MEQQLFLAAFSKRLEQIWYKVYNSIGATKKYRLFPDSINLIPSVLNQAE